MCSSSLSNLPDWINLFIQSLIVLVAAVTVCNSNKSHKEIMRLNAINKLIEIANQIALRCNANYIRNENSPFKHVTLISDLIISIETIETSLKIYNLKLISEHRAELYYLVWKQLDTEAREVVTYQLKKPRENDDIYHKQLATVYKYYSDYIEDNHIEIHLDPRVRIELTKLKEI